MLAALKNRSLTKLKITPRTTSPSTEGRAPGSPDRRRPTYSRTAPATSRRSTSREKLLARSPLPGAGAPPAAGWSVIWSLMSDALVRGGGGQAEVSAAAAGDQL